MYDSLGNYDLDDFESFEKFTHKGTGEGKASKRPRNDQIRAARRQKEKAKKAALEEIEAAE